MRTRVTALLSIAATAFALSIGSVAAEESTPGAEGPAATSVVVPVFGTDLVINVAIDAEGGFGGATMTDIDGNDATGYDAVVDDEHGAFEVHITSTETGFEVEVEASVSEGIVLVGDTEIEGVAPGAIAGTHHWAASVLGGDIAIEFAVTLNPDGSPEVIATPSSSGGILAFVHDATELSEPNEGEWGYRQVVEFWLEANVDEYVQVVIFIEIEDGEAELKIELVDPAADEDDHDDEDEDDDHDDD